MEPVTLIVAALAAGAAAGAQGTATDAVKDAYNGLKSLVRRRLAGRSDGAQVLERHEAAPEEWHPRLEAELVEADAGADPAAVDAARHLMALLDGGTSARYQMDFRGAQGVQHGHGNVQVNHFGPGPASSAQ
jgi:hypothetical protein